MSDSGKPTLVVVEDSAPNRKILAHLLMKLGFEIYEYENGQKAWTAMSEGELGDIAGVISDLMMPEMDGLQLLETLRQSENFNKTPFLFVTAVADKESIVKAKESQANGYILKPISYEKVSKKIQELFPDMEIKEAS